MDRDKLSRLIRAWQRQRATPQEKAMLDAWYASFEGDPGWTESLSHAERETLHARMFADFDRSHLRGRTRFGLLRPRRAPLWAAASVVLLAVVAALFVDLPRKAPADTVATTVGVDLLPGGPRAILGLPDGRQIILNEIETGIRVDNGLQYQDGSPVLGVGETGGTDLFARASQWMTLTTPRGGTYQVTLPDGSRVWLNAASTLDYPSRFEGAARRVRLDGEAYFEISAQPGHGDRGQRPFLVEVGDQLVEVTGTQFNISAYRDEQFIRTTLVEGGLTIHAGSEVPGSDESGSGASPAVRSLVLLPGEQGIFEHGRLAKEPVNVAAAIAWKNGDFFFENEPLESIMNRMARWYDAEVVYQDAPKGLRFYGMVSRSKNISTVLDVLQMTDQVKIEIEGPETGQKERRIRVMR